MSEDSRRTIEELIVRYELEPDLADIFVEGQFDVDLLQCALEGSVVGCTIYSIDSVEVSAEVLRRHSLTSGNKQRVLALAKELSESVDQLCKYLCVVDKDLDYWLELREEVCNLYYTRFASLEMHFLDPSYIRRLTTVVLKAKISNFETVYESFCEVLIKLYCLRLVSKELGLNLDLINPGRSLTEDEGALIFDFDDYVQKCVNKSGQFDQLSTIVVRANEWFEIVKTEDCRQCVHGHDFISLVSYLAHSHSGMKAISKPEAIPQFYLSSAQAVSSLVEEASEISNR